MNLTIGTRGTYIKTYWMPHLLISGIASVCIFPIPVLLLHFFCPTAFPKSSNYLLVRPPLCPGSLQSDAKLFSHRSLRIVE
ncbi:hypothetical protein BDZ89DRAFT_277002 [Hymenopellis radicata]|nr:hypothetical protein BDZ89DRAFT_277002 [Hymenopellis radicata]